MVGHVAVADRAVGLRPDRVRSLGRDGRRPATSSSMSGRQPATTADAIDHSDQPRMRGFYQFGVIAPIATAASTLVLGDERDASTFTFTPPTAST